MTLSLPSGRLLAVGISLRVASLVEESFGRELASGSASSLEMELGLLFGIAFAGDLET